MPGRCRRAGVTVPSGHAAAARRVSSSSVGGEYAAIRPLGAVYTAAALRYAPLAAPSRSPHRDGDVLLTLEVTTPAAVPAATATTTSVASTTMIAFLFLLAKEAGRPPSSSDLTSETPGSAILRSGSRAAGAGWCRGGGLTLRDWGRRDAAGEVGSMPIALDATRRARGASSGRERGWMWRWGCGVRGAGSARRGCYIARRGRRRCGAPAAAAPPRS
jgi:hypothetical protein